MSSDESQTLLTWQIESQTTTGSSMRNNDEIAKRIIPLPPLHSQNNLNRLDQNRKIDKWPQMFDVIEVVL